MTEGHGPGILYHTPAGWRRTTFARGGIGSHRSAICSEVDSQGRVDYSGDVQLSAFACRNILMEESDP